MRKRKNKQRLRTALWTLLLWWWIIISNEIITIWIYTVIHYWKFVLFPLFIYRLVMSIIKIFNLRNYISYDEWFYNTKRWNGISIAGWVLIIGGITLMGIYNKEIKLWERDSATYLSNQIEFREWKIPVIYIWEINDNK